ncbi:uncharacterized protein B0T23DRAFT_24099 [Neurospora hispaniola]|uniref:Uncharacterized protein n=1 Tax=Neurospora hispaniola TaxID=588809 RepID=A0AAJ0IG53_9PEZI|nr:hypothetical protein B0T23DRAFT_24099 [Neurospora hispaniola]
MYTEMTIQPREWNKCCQSVSGTPLLVQRWMPARRRMNRWWTTACSIRAIHTWDGMGRIFFFFAASRLNKNWHLRLPFFFLLLLVYLSVPFSVEIHHHPLSFSVPQPPQTSVWCWPSGSCIAALTVVELGSLS